MVRHGVQTLDVLDCFDVLEPDAADLPTIDLSSPADNGPVRFDRRAYEDRYAELAFGLGTVPRRQHRDDAWWETPIGMLAAVVGSLVLLWISTAAG